MTPLDALLELLERVGASRDAAALVSEEELSRWPAEAVRELKAKKLLQRASPAVSVVCPGCEQECVMPVHTPSAGAGAAASFVVCDKRDDINRVAVSAERLRQWRCGAEAVGAFVAQSLGLRPGSQRKRCRAVGAWTCDGQEAQPDGLPASERRIGTGGRAECGSIGRACALRGGRLFRGLRSNPATGGCGDHGDTRYTPSIARAKPASWRRKPCMRSWQKEYRALKQRHPGMSDVWYLAANCQDGHCERAQRRNDPQTHEAIKKLGGIFSPNLPARQVIALRGFPQMHGRAAGAVVRPPSAQNAAKTLEIAD